jgi:hypothetical protein
MGSQEKSKHRSLGKTRKKSVLKIYLKDSLAILSESIRLAREDHPEFYRVVALELRLLLCDATRIHNQWVDISLVHQLYPQLKWSSEGWKEGRARLLKIADWLELPAMTDDPQHRTIRKFIRQICDLDGGAHVNLGDSSHMATVRSIYNLLRIGEFVYMQLLLLLEVDSVE